MEPLMKTMHENQAEKDNMLNYISQLEVKITNASNKRKQVGQQQDLNFQKIQENKSNLSANSSNISDPEQQPQPKPIIKKNFESYTSNLLNKDFPGKKLIAAVPSLDTGVCLTSAKKFNQKVQNFTLIYVSADLPFAGARACNVENLDNVHTLSMMRNKDFAVDYGLLLVDGPLEGLCARAIFALDENNKILYSELVSEITEEPNYEAVTSAIS